MHGAVTGHLAIAHAIDCRERYFGTHLLQIARQQTTRLGGGLRPMRHPDRAAGDQCRAEEWRRVRQVGLNGHLARQLHCARFNRPCAGGFVGLNRTAGTGHIGHGHANVRQARGLLPRVREVQTARQFGTNQQQAGDELGRTGRIDADLRLGSRQGCRRRNSERQTANLAVVINRCTQLFQTVKHRLHRTCISLFVAIKIHWAICKQGKAGHETHHRAGQSAEHIDVAMESAGYRRSNRYGGVGCGIHVAADTEGFECAHHKVRVARTQQANQSNGLAAEGGENQVAVG